AVGGGTPRPVPGLRSRPAPGRVSLRTNSAPNRIYSRGAGRRLICGADLSWAEFTTVRVMINTLPQDKACAAGSRAAVTAGPGRHAKAETNRGFVSRARWQRRANTSRWSLYAYFEKAPPCWWRTAA